MALYIGAPTYSTWSSPKKNNPANLACSIALLGEGFRWCAAWLGRRQNGCPETLGMGDCYGPVLYYPCYTY